MTSSERYKLEKEVSNETELYFSSSDFENKIYPSIVTDYPIHYNLRTLSYSGILTLHSCPRKYELSRLTTRQVSEDEDEHGHLSFGKVVGNGIQEYFISGDRNKSMLRMFLDWNDNLDEEKGERSAKTFWHALRALDKFINFREEALKDYEVAYFQGAPASELGFEINCGEGFRYRGKLDLLLIHKFRKEFLVLEAKTTGNYTVDEASYKNSSQALGYGLVVDRIAHNLGFTNDYNVLYPIYLTRSQEWREFRFPKSNVQRARWLQQILLDIGAITQYSDISLFPLYGESCFSYNRQCKYFGLCTLSNKSLLLENPGIRLDKEDEYPFKFSIDELIEAQVAKIEEEQ